MGNTKKIPSRKDHPWLGILINIFNKSDQILIEILKI